MSITRRKFLQLSIHGAVLIGAGNVLTAFADPSFELPPKRKIRLRFAIASDGHFGQKNTEWQAMHEQMLAWINAEHKGRGLNFTFINGDLYHDDISHSPAVHQLWSRLTMPWYVSHGNHDHSTEADWEQAWGKPWHYGFDHRKIAFAVLNTADPEGKYICPDLEKARQLLEQYSGHKQLFVFMHITPIKWTGAGIDCPELVEMFSHQQNLKAIFHGHDHDEDSVKESGGKHYFFDSHIGGNWGTDYHGYRIVEVLKNGDILTYQLNGTTGQKVNSNSV